MDESKGKKNRGLIIALSVLVGLIAVLVVAIVVVNVNTHRNVEMNYEEYEQRLTSATEDCAMLRSLYSSGAVSKEVAEETYDKKMAEAGDDSVYRVNLAFCYVQHIRYHGATFEEVLTRLKEIEPYLSTDGDWIDYYDRLVVYYIEEDDWDKVHYYASLRDELIQIEGDDSEWGGETDNPFVPDEQTDEYNNGEEE